MLNKLEKQRNNNFRKRRRGKTQKITKKENVDRMLTELVDEKYFPRYDIHKFGQLLTGAMTKALELMKQLGIKHATYLAIPCSPPDSGCLMRIEVPLDEFPLLPADIEPDSSNVEEFRLILTVADKIEFSAETDIETLLANRVLLDVLTGDNLLKLVNAFEKWINDHVQYLEEHYKSEPEELKWHLNQPDFLQKKQLYHKLHQEMVKKTDATP